MQFGLRRAAPFVSSPIQLLNQKWWAAREYRCVTSVISYIIRFEFRSHLPCNPSQCDVCDVYQTYKIQTYLQLSDALLYTVYPTVLYNNQPLFVSRLSSTTTVCNALKRVNIPSKIFISINLRTPDNFTLKGKGLDTCYSATYMSQTRDQQRFTISEVAADWHEPMVPQRIMWPSIARANGQLDPRCS